MRNFATISPGRSSTCGIELFRLWDVEEDGAYQIERSWETWDSPGTTMLTEGRPGLCAIRTISGTGQVKMNDKEGLTLGPDSLVILPWLDMTGWGTVGDAWRFYWFEFFADDLDPLILREPAQIVCTSDERAGITSIQNQIRSVLTPTRNAASARFSAMLYGWLEQACDESVSHPEHAGIDKAIRLMHDSVHKQLSVAEMAKQAGLSARAFATTFEQATGQTPKRYHLNLRLDAARALLLSDRANVKQAAERLGFNSPFYLSKLYRNRFGHPPSQAH